MLLCILMYSLCTGLSAVSWSFWSFRVLSLPDGLGRRRRVRGRRVAGGRSDARPGPAACLGPVASTIGYRQHHGRADRHRPVAIARWLGQWHLFGITLTPWRAMFMVGALPAFLALAIFKKLKEPERWQAVAHEDVVEKQLGSYGRLFGDPRWRRRAWRNGPGRRRRRRAVGHRVFQPGAEPLGVPALLRAAGPCGGAAENDRRLWPACLPTPRCSTSSARKSIRPICCRPSQADNDAAAIYGAALELHKAGKPITRRHAVGCADHPAANRSVAQSAANSRRAQPPAAVSATRRPLLPELKVAADDIVARSGQIASALTLVGGDCADHAELRRRLRHVLVQPCRPALRPPADVRGVLFGALISTAVVFSCMSSTTIMVGGHPIFVDVFWLIPIMGFWQLSLFSGYAIYFPELFPTYLRSTGTSFCYNVGRFVAAAGPYIFGTLDGRRSATRPNPSAGPA